MRPRIDEFGVCTEDSRLTTAIGEPSSDLFNRALVGWERFLSTLKREVDE